MAEQKADRTSIFDVPTEELERQLGFDPKALCIFCEQPVERLSCGGVLICPACDCGHYRHDHPDKRKRGKRWSGMDGVMFYANARRRMSAPAQGGAKE